MSTVNVTIAMLRHLLRSRTNRIVVLVFAISTLVCSLLLVYYSTFAFEDHSVSIKHRSIQIHQNDPVSRDSALGFHDETPAYLIILLLSAPGNAMQRNAVRETWLSSASRPPDVTHYFVIGTRQLSDELKHNISVEHREYGDLLLLPDVTDSYSKLTDKLLAAYSWVDRNLHFSFLFKGDDDTYALVSRLSGELRAYEPRRLYWGFFDGRARVKRSGSWGENKWTLCDRYLPHARGGGYILSADLVHYISDNAEWLQRFVSEDVSVGAWLAALDIKRIHDPRFDTEYLSRGCSERYVVTHKQLAEDMYNRHAHLKATGRQCVNGEIRTRMSYVYNWHVPPTLCCIRNDTSVP